MRFGLKKEISNENFDKNKSININSKLKIKFLPQENIFV